MTNKKRYRYSDGRTFTDGLTLARAKFFQRVQGGGTITPMKRTPKSGVEHLAQHPGWKTTKKPQKRKLNASDVATILAALRLFQREYEGCDALVIADAWPMHFNVQGNGGEIGGQDVSDELVVVPEPLGTDDIDELCERLNLWAL